MYPCAPPQGAAASKGIEHNCCWTFLEKWQPPLPEVFTSMGFSQDVLSNTVPLDLLKVFFVEAKRDDGLIIDISNILTYPLVI
jgi:hypothetical protein